MSDLEGAAAATGRIDPADIDTPGNGLPAKYTDEAIVNLVVEDTRRAQAYLDEKQWNLHWQEADILYQSPRTARTFEGSTVTRANVARFTVAKATQTLVPGMQSGIFYEQPPFVMRPRPAINESTIRAKTALYSVLLDKCKFEQRAKRGMETQVTFGTAFFKGGWEVTTKTRKRFIRKNSPISVEMPMQDKPAQIHTAESDEMKVEDVEYTENKPFFEECELGTIMVDPGWRDANDLETAKYLVHRRYVTFNDLEDLRENKLYQIPNRKALRDYLFANPQGAAMPSDTEESLNNQAIGHHAELSNEVTSADPLEQPIELLERWDQTNCHSILRTSDDKCVIIRKGEHTLSRIPFFACNFWNIPGAAYGMGTGRLIGNDQRIEKGLIDAVLDILSFALNPQYARDSGANISTQQIRQRLGGIVDVTPGPGRKATDAFGIIESPRVPPEVFAVLQSSQQSSNAAVGSDEAFTQGTLPGKGNSSAGRTATGAGGIIAANAGRIQGPVGHFVDGVLLPFMKLLGEMVREFMPMSEIRQILGDELGDDYELDLEDFYNSEDKIETLAGAHLAAKKAMAQSLPLMISVLENPHLVEQLNQMGYMVDVKQIFSMFMEMSEWKNSRELIRPMTPEEKQAYQAASGAQQKTQAMLAQVQAKHTAKSAEIDQQAEARLGHDLFLNSAEEAANYVERGVSRNAQRAGVFGTEQ